MVRSGWTGGPGPGPPDARSLHADARRLFARDAAAVTWSAPVCPAACTPPATAAAPSRASPGAAATERPTGWRSGPASCLAASPPSRSRAGRRGPPRGPWSRRPRPRGARATRGAAGSTVRRGRHALRSYRGPAADGTCSVHPPNALKAAGAPLLLLDAVERRPGPPAAQAGRGEDFVTWWGDVGGARSGPAGAGEPRAQWVPPGAT
jgi:hypothetical protein